MAAALHLRGDAVVSHAAAAFVWWLTDDAPPIIELTLVGRNAHPQPGIVIHRVAALDRDDIAWRRDLPVTSPARTLVDRAAVLRMIELEAELAEARHLGVVRNTQIHAALERTPHSPGGAALRELLHADLNRTRSGYERKLLALIAAADLPPPLTNVKLQGHLVDMVWPAQRLVLEFDGFKFHGDRRASERDRRRDQDLIAAGYRVIRVTARQVDQQTYATIARLAAALAP